MSTEGRMRSPNIYIITLFRNNNPLLDLSIKYGDFNDLTQQVECRTLPLVYSSLRSRNTIKKAIDEMAFFYTCYFRYANNLLCQLSLKGTTQALSNWCS